MDDVHGGEGDEEVSDRSWVAAGTAALLSSRLRCGSRIGPGVMKKIHFISMVALVLGSFVSSGLYGQETKPSGDATAKSQAEARSGQAYSGMYTFLKEGEFVQVTVEDTTRHWIRFTIRRWRERQGSVSGSVFQDREAGWEQAEFHD